MLIETNQDQEFISFRTNDIDSFVIEHSDNIGDEKIEILKDAMNQFNESFEQIKIPVTSIPMILYSGYRIIKDNKSFDNLIDIINEFLTTYESNDDYKQFVQSGTSSAENVRGRFDYWRELIRTA